MCCDVQQTRGQNQRQVVCIDSWRCPQEVATLLTLLKKSHSAVLDFSSNHEHFIKNKRDSTMS